MSEERDKRRVIFAKLAVALSLIVVLPILGCGSSEKPEERAYVAEASDSLPGETAQDWATFSDHLGVVTPVAESQTESEFVEPGKYLVGRELTLEIVEVLWSREEAPHLPKSISFAQGGWINADGVKYDFDTGGSPRMKIGHKYLIPLVKFSTGEWGPLTSSNILSYDSNQIGNGTKAIGVQESSWVDEFYGKNAMSVAVEMKTTPPYRDAENLMDLEPEKRYQALVDSER